MRPAERLERRLRPVWDESVQLRVDRRVGRDAGSTYLVLPSLLRPVLLVPAGDAAAAAAFRRVDEGQRARFVLHALAWAQQHRLLRWLPLARVRIGHSDASAVLGALRAAVPEATSVVIRLGRPRPGRAVVLQALAGDGRSLAFAKCAHGDRVAYLRREHAQLIGVGEKPAPGVRAPRVLGFRDAEGAAVLVLEALVPSRRAVGSGAPVTAMRALAGRAGDVSAPLAGTGVLAQLRSGIEALADTAARDWLRVELDRLLSELGDVVVRTGTWHGDWVGWNMARDGDTVMLWDWEHAETGVPLGLDHVHHLAQDLRMNVGTSPDVEDRWLSAARLALRRDWGVGGAAAEATLRTYLVVVNLRYVEDRQDDPGSTSQREGWSHELLARLGGSQACERNS